MGLCYTCVDQFTVEVIEQVCLETCVHTLAPLLHTCVQATRGFMRDGACRIMLEQLTRVPLPRSVGASAALQSQASTAYGAAWVRALV